MPSQNPETTARNTASRRAVYAANRAAGLCKCGRPPAPGRTKCERCRAYQAKSDAKLREQRKAARDAAIAAGACSRCLRRPAAPGRKQCTECRAETARNAEARRERLRAQGLCLTCGKLPTDGVRCPDCAAKLAARDDREARRLYDRARIIALRETVIAGYGGQCACCGETEHRFLTLDHVNNDGGHERLSMSNRQIYQAAITEGFPDRFQLLCANCNLGRHWNGGTCPHVAQVMERLTTRALTEVPG